MQLNEFENHIANNIDSYESEINTDSLWDTLESDLDKKKKKRRGIILLLALLSLSVLCYIGMSTHQTASGNDNGSATSKVKEILFVDQMRTLTESESNTIADNKLNNDINTKSDSNRETLTTPYNQAKPRAVNTSDTRSSQTKATSIVQGVSMPNFTSNQSIPTSQIDLRNTLDKRPTVSSSNLNEENIRNPDYLDFIPMIPLNMFEMERPKIKLKKRPSLMPSKQWRLFVTPQVGIYYTDRKIRTNKSTGESLRDYRNNSEQTLETLSLDVGVELQHKSNFYISGGVHLNQSTFKFFNQSSNFTIERIEYIQEINLLTNGVVEEVAGMFDQGQETIRTTTAYNTLRWAELSLGGGYRFTKSRWQVGAGTGMMWGGMLNAKGRILDANRNIIDIQNQSESIYNSNLGLGAYANLDIRYALNPKISLSSQFRYKFYRNSVTESSYPLDITYQWWGASIGLSYQIH